MKRLLTVSLLLLAAVSLRAQNVIDLIISEVMVDNCTSVTDDFGEHSAWIEIFNTSQGTVNFAGCYFSDDLDNLTKSPVTKGDNRTKVGPRQVALFFADGDSSKGTFYLNFELKKGSTLYLISNDGHTVIDSIDIPEEIAAIDRECGELAHQSAGLSGQPRNSQTPVLQVEAQVP